MSGSIQNLASPSPETTCTCILDSYLEKKKNLNFPSRKIVGLMNAVLDMACYRGRSRADRLCGCQTLLQNVWQFSKARNIRDGSKPGPPKWRARLPARWYVRWSKTILGNGMSAPMSIHCGKDSARISKQES